MIFKWTNENKKSHEQEKIVKGKEKRESMLGITGRIFGNLFLFFCKQLKTAIR